MMLATTNDPAAAVATLGNGKMLTSVGVALYGSPLMWVIMLAPLGFVFFLSFRINTMSVSAAQTAFWAFAALMGLSLSSIFLVYTGASIAQVFFITAATFGAMSLCGYTTKRDLTGMGIFLFMGLIGLIIAMLVNIFLQSLDAGVRHLGDRRADLRRASPPTTRRRSRRCISRATTRWSPAEGDHGRADALPRLHQPVHVPAAVPRQPRVTQLARSTGSKGGPGPPFSFAPAAAFIRA